MMTRLELQPHMPNALMSGMEFAPKLRKLMFDRRMSQVELAERVGTHQPQVSKWLSGEAVPRTPTMLRIARAVGVPLDFLVDDEMDEPPGPLLSPGELAILRMVRRLGEEEAERRLLQADPRPRVLGSSERDIPLKEKKMTEAPGKRPSTAE